MVSGLLPCEAKCFVETVIPAALLRNRNEFVIGSLKTNRSDHIELGERWQQHVESLRANHAEA
jgi:hypothetical protein